MEQPSSCLNAQCLKIAQKDPFNIAPSVDVKNAKNGPFWRILENLMFAVK